MSKENKKTLEVYQKLANVYLSNNLKHDELDPVKAEKKLQKLHEFIKLSFSSLPKHAKIFEIGSGDGLNAKFIENLGFKVTASDTAYSFIKTTKNHGLNTINFNALEDEFLEKYYAVFCWRVFVHFTKEDALKVIQKVYDALEDDGIFVFNAINREFKDVDSEWIDFDGEYHLGAERYYNYFSKEELDNIISLTNFKIAEFHKEGGNTYNKWLVYVLKNQPFWVQFIY
ncbi:MAG: class I SAM-dependent methyltransferase [Clostridia bacterium]|nr:class I SAM-dependent methyltransferase [Clostridia bacterium]